MSIEAALTAFLISNADVQAIAGNRVYPLALPQGASFPAITYYRTSQEAVKSFAGLSGLSRATLTVDVWATNYSDAKALADAIRGNRSAQKLDGFRGTIGNVNIESCFCTAEIDLHEKPVHGDERGVYHTALDFEFWYEDIQGAGSPLNLGVPFSAVAGGGVSPGGITGQLQYNNAGSFGGTTGIKYVTNLNTVDSNLDPNGIGLTPGNRTYYIGTQDSGGAMVLGLSTIDNALMVQPGYHTGDNGNITLASITGSGILNIRLAGGTLVFCPAEAGGTGVIQFGRRFFDNNNDVGASVEFWTNRTQTVPAWRVKAPGGSSGDVAYCDPVGQTQAAGFASTIVNKTAAYTLAKTDSFVTADATSAAFAVTLPAANSTIAAREYTVKKIDSSVNAVTLTAAGTDKIDGSATFALGAQYKYVKVVSDGSSKWWVVANN